MCSTKILEEGEYGRYFSENVLGVGVAEFRAVCLEVAELVVDGERQVLVEIVDDVVEMYTVGEEAVGCIDAVSQADDHDFGGNLVDIFLQVHELD